MPLVLIVMDEPDTMLELHVDLELLGHQTVLAADADTALERLGALPIDVVILDVMMPVRDGWVVLEAAQRQSPPVPALVMSRRARPRDLERATRLGAGGTLSPHLDAEALHAAVGLALAQGAGRPAGGTVGADQARLRTVPSKRRIR